MNIFKTTQVTWWEMGMIKMAVFSIGIAVGIYYSDALRPYVTSLVSFGVVLGVYCFVRWVRK